MISRTTDPNNTLQQLQQLVLDAEGIGYQLQTLVGASFQGVSFNHLTLEIAPKLPNLGPYTQLLTLAPGVTDAAKDPQIVAATAKGAKLLFASSVYISDNLVSIAVVR